MTGSINVDLADGLAAALNSPTVPFALPFTAVVHFVPYVVLEEKNKSQLTKLKVLVAPSTDTSDSSMRGLQQDELKADVIVLSPLPQGVDPTNRDTCQPIVDLIKLVEVIKKALQPGTSIGDIQITGTTADPIYVREELINSSRFFSIVRITALALV